MTERLVPELHKPDILQGLVNVADVFVGDLMSLVFHDVNSMGCYCYFAADQNRADKKLSSALAETKTVALQSCMYAVCFKVAILLYIKA